MTADITEREIQDREHAKFEEEITRLIIVVLHEDNWETDLKSLATEKPLQEWSNSRRALRLASSKSHGKTGC
jgi:hypothetical protein